MAREKAKFDHADGVPNTINFPLSNEGESYQSTPTVRGSFTFTIQTAEARVCFEVTPEGAEEIEMFIESGRVEDSQIISVTAADLTDLINRNPQWKVEKSVEPAES